MVNPTESIGDLDKSVNTGLNMFKGIRRKKKVLVKFNLCFTMARQIKMKTQIKDTDLAF